VTGTVLFAESAWDGKSSAAFYAMDFIAQRLPAGPLRDEIRELADGNVLILDLCGPAKAAAVDLLSDALPAHLDAAQNAEALHVMFDDLIACARRQQFLNTSHP
jgi:hypothetical protein